MRWWNGEKKQNWRECVERDRKPDEMERRDPCVVYVHGVAWLVCGAGMLSRGAFALVSHRNFVYSRRLSRYMCITHWLTFTFTSIRVTRFYSFIIHIVCLIQIGWPLFFFQSFFLLLDIFLSFSFGQKEDSKILILSRSNCRCRWHCIFKGIQCISSPNLSFMHLISYLYHLH